jgi:ABC-2 type transport system permease protein
MRSIIALAGKDLKLLYRDRFGLFWVAMFPLLMALFFGSIFSSGGGGTSRAMRVAFIGTGDSARVEPFFAELSQSEALSLRRMPLDSARQQVGAGKLVAYVHYTDTSGSEFGMFGPGRPSIKVGLDPSRRAEAGYLQGLVTRAYFTLMQQSMMNPGELGASLSEQVGSLDSAAGLSARQRGLLLGFLGQLDTFLTTVETNGEGSPAAASPFSEPDMEFKDIAVDRQGPRSSWEITFPQSLQWALIGVAAAFALSMVVERTRGTYLRLRLAPIGRAHILAGKGLACFTACMMSCVLLLSIGIVIFGVRVASPGGLAAAVLSAGFCFVGIMMLVSVLGKTEQAVGGAGWAMLLVFSMLGGGMVPLVMMPSWMSTLGSISPVKWSILAMEGAIWRGFDAAQMATPILILLGMGLAGFVVGTAMLARTDT